MERKTGLDIVRAIATFSVIAVHFLLNTNFYTTRLSGYGMIILTGLRNILLICVPLFLLLTGYLNSHKELNKEYFKGIKKVIMSYLFIAVICVLIRIFYFKEEHDLIYWILSPLSFNANGYSWYIEMYLGLYLLIPFLNILYKNLDTQKNKRTLIIVLLIVISFSSITSGFTLLGERLKLLPEYWVESYPILYYFIGAYIKEYQPKLSNLKCIAYIVIIILIQTTLSLLLNSKGYFDKGLFGRYHNILTLIVSILVFIMFYNKNIKNKTLNKLVSSISKYSLDMYLFSYIIDLKIYKIINSIADTPKLKVMYMLPTVVVVFAASFFFSAIKKIIFDFITNQKIKKNSKNSKYPDFNKVFP